MLLRRAGLSASAGLFSVLCVCASAWAVVSAIGLSVLWNTFSTCFFCVILFVTCCVK